MSQPAVDMLQGTLDVLVLKTLSWGPMHGYAVARWLQQVTDDVLQIEEGSLYPALHRLERRGWVESEWGVSENNRRAKYYRITDRGSPSAPRRGVHVVGVLASGLEGADARRPPAV